LLLTPDVKCERRDLFNRERELSEVLNAIRNGERLIIVCGVRRIGKSSLVNVALREVGEPFIIIDVRALYFNSGFRGVTERVLVEDYLRKIRESKRLFEKIRDELSDLASRIESITIGPLGVRVKRGRGLRLTEILSEIDDWCSRRRRRFIIALDEAQYLRFSNRRFNLLLAWSIDNLKNIVHVLTGSEVGLLRDFLKLDSPDSPLRGRVRREIYLERFSYEESLEFLKRGFEEVEFKAPLTEIEDAVRKLNGVPGWLTLYGYYRAVRRLSHRDALNLVLEEGSALVISELGRIIEKSKARYTAILKAIASGCRRWSDIKAFTEARTGPIPDNRFNELLEKLTKYGYVEKTNEEYTIEDPIVKYVALNKL
jgi:AAA+ ATPase superfamily predicted ATPase